MRTDPFTDSWLFFLGQQGDETALGPWRWLIVALFVLLLLGSLFVAALEWAEDPRQRTGRDLGLWITRVIIGCMWFPNTLWKLPLFTTENGLYFWTSEETKYAAFQFHRDLVQNLLLPTPNFLVLDGLVFLTEMAFAVSLILGLGVRLTGAIGVLFVIQLWLGLYQHPNEWPWSYVFLACLMGLFSLLAAGRSLGLDASLRRAYPPDMTNGAVAAFVRVAT